MNIHRVHLIGFSKSGSATNTYPSSNVRIKDPIYAIDTKTLYKAKKEETKCKERYKSPPKVKKKRKKTTLSSETSPHCNHIASIERESSVERKFLLKKVKSESKRFCSNYSLKNMSQRSVSLMDVKNLFSTQCQYYHNIKRAVKTIKRDLSLARDINKMNTGDKKVRIIYKSNPKKVWEPPSLLKSSIKRRKVNKCGGDASTSTDIFETPIFGFYKNNRLSFPHTAMYKRGQNDNSYLFHLLKRNSTKKKRNNESIILDIRRVPTIRRVDSSRFFTSTHNRLHYDSFNVSKKRRVDSNRSRLNYRLYIQQPKYRDKPQCSHSKSASNKRHRGKRVDISLSSLKFNGMGTSKVLIKSPSVCKKSVSFRQSPLTSYPSKECQQRGDVNQSILLRLFKSGVIFKYLIMGVITVVWFPCIFAVGCAWLLTYPLRTEHLIGRNNDLTNMKNEPETNIATKIYYTNPWTYVVSNMRKWVQKFTNVSDLKSVLRFDKFDSNGVSKRRKPSCDQNMRVFSMSTKSGLESKICSKSKNNINMRNTSPKKGITGNDHQRRTSPVICERMKQKYSWKQYLYKAAEFVMRGQRSVETFYGGSRVWSPNFAEPCSRYTPEWSSGAIRDPCLLRLSTPCISKEWAPRRSKLSTPCFSRQLSPCLSRQSPTRPSKQSSRRPSKQSSPRRSKQSSPRISKQLPVSSLKQSSPRLSTQLPVSPLKQPSPYISRQSLPFGADEPCLDTKSCATFSSQTSISSGIITPKENPKEKRLDESNKIEEMYIREERGKKDTLLYSTNERDPLCEKRNIEVQRKKNLKMEVERLKREVLDERITYEMTLEDEIKTGSGKVHDKEIKKEDEKEKKTGKVLGECCKEEIKKEDEKEKETAKVLGECCKEEIKKEDEREKETGKALGEGCKEEIKKEDEREKETGKVLGEGCKEKIKKEDETKKGTEKLLDKKNKKEDKRKKKTGKLVKKEGIKKENEIKKRTDKVLDKGCKKEEKKKKITGIVFYKGSKKKDKKKKGTGKGLDKGSKDKNSKNVKVKCKVKESKKGTKKKDEENNKKKEKKSGPDFCDLDRDKGAQSCKQLLNCNAIDQQIAEGIYPRKFTCKYLFLLTWKKRPHFWIYYKCPRFYFKFINLYGFLMSIFRWCLYCLAICLWCPVFVGLSFCYQTFRNLLCCGC